jgi:hypothetical protein
MVLLLFFVLAGSDIVFRSSSDVGLRRGAKIQSASDLQRFFAVV